MDPVSLFLRASVFGSLGLSRFSDSEGAVFSWTPSLRRPRIYVHSVSPWLRGPHFCVDFDLNKLEEHGIKAATIQYGLFAVAQSSLRALKPNENRAELVERAVQCCKQLDVTVAPWFLALASD